MEGISCFTREDVGLVSMRMTSSANRLILYVLWPISKPVILGFCLMCSTRGSMSRLKISGDNGHPCLVPLIMANGWDIISAENTWAEGVVYSASKAFNICPLNSNFWRTCCRYFQCILSNAFSAFQ